MKDDPNDKALDAALDTLFNRYSRMIQGNKQKKAEKEPPKKKKLVEELSEEDFLDTGPPKRQFVRLGKKKNGVSNANAR